MVQERSATVVDFKDLKGIDDLRQLGEIEGEESDPVDALRRLEGASRPSVAPALRGSIVAVPAKVDHQDTAANRDQIASSTQINATDKAHASPAKSRPVAAESHHQLEHLTDLAAQLSAGLVVVQTVGRASEERDQRSEHARQMYGLRLADMETTLQEGMTRAEARETRLRDMLSSVRVGRARVDPAHAVQAQSELLRLDLIAVPC